MDFPETCPQTGCGFPMRQITDNYGTCFFNAHRYYHGPVPAEPRNRSGHKDPLLSAIVSMDADIKSRAWIERRKREGLCVTCERPRGPHGTEWKCRRCANRDNARKRPSRAKWRKQSA